MKRRKSNPNQATKLSGLAFQGPGANLNPNPQALTEILHCLAPKAAQDHQLLTILRAYVFPVPWQASPGPQEIRQRLRQSLQAGEQKHLDDLLTMLEGMKALIAYHKFQSPEELDGYLQAHKEMFGRFLSNQAGRAQTGRAGKTL